MNVLFFSYTACTLSRTISGLKCSYDLDGSFKLGILNIEYSSTNAFQQYHRTNNIRRCSTKCQNALGHSNFSHKLEYMSQVTQQSRRNKQRNIIWFNPPSSKNVKTNIALSFLHLLDTHFPADYTLHKFSIGTESATVA